MVFEERLLFFEDRISVVCQGMFYQSVRSAEKLEVSMSRLSFEMRSGGLHDKTACKFTIEAGVVCIDKRDLFWQE
jgi:hypothetical protein